MTSCWATTRASWACCRVIVVAEAGIPKDIGIKANAIAEKIFRVLIFYSC
jgi:hypothetical protein